MNSKVYLERRAYGKSTMTWAIQMVAKPSSISVDMVVFLIGFWGRRVQKSQPTKRPNTKSTHTKGRQHFRYAYGYRREGNFYYTLVAPAQQCRVYRLTTLSIIDKYRANTSSDYKNLKQRSPHRGSDALTHEESCCCCSGDNLLEVTHCCRRTIRAELPNTHQLKSLPGRTVGRYSLLTNP